MLYGSGELPSSLQFYSVIPCSISTKISRYSMVQQKAQTSVKVKESIQIQKMTLDTRGDPNLIFYAEFSFDPSTNKAVDDLFAELTLKVVL